MGVGRGYLSLSFGYLRRRWLWETGCRMQRSLSKDRHLGKDVSAGNNAWLLIFTMMSSHDFGILTFNAHGPLPSICLAMFMENVLTLRTSNLFD
jgi:hypothetical protein